jgi:type I restriction enzyme, S subunit
MTRIETAAGEGALFKSLSKQQLAGLPVLVSDAAITQAIVSLLDPLTARMMAAASQAELLSTLRDTLLPRLISGKLRLPEASAAVEEALA